jgi:hypothetical protein
MLSTPDLQASRAARESNWAAPDIKPDGSGAKPRPGQTVLLSTLALIVLADGAADAVAACTVAAPDDAEDAPVEGEDAGLAAGAV